MPTAKPIINARLGAVEDTVVTFETRYTPDGAHHDSAERAQQRQAGGEQRPERDRQNREGDHDAEDGRRTGLGRHRAVGAAPHMRGHTGLFGRSGRVDQRRQTAGIQVCAGDGVLDLGQRGPPIRGDRLGRERVDNRRDLGAVLA